MVHLSDRRHCTILPERSQRLVLSTDQSRRASGKSQASCPQAWPGNIPSGQSQGKPADFRQSLEDMAFGRHLLYNLRGLHRHDCLAPDILEVFLRRQRSHRRNPDGSVLDLDLGDPHRRRECVGPSGGRKHRHPLASNHAGRSHPDDHLKEFRAGGGGRDIDGSRNGSRERGGVQTGATRST